MKNQKTTLVFLCMMTALGGCASTATQTHNRPSVSYSNETINNDDSPPIEENTPVGKAIAIMDSSNPELITEYHMINDPELVASHIERPKDKRWFVPGRTSRKSDIEEKPLEAPPQTDSPYNKKIEDEPRVAPQVTPAQHFKAVHHVVPPTPQAQNGAFSFSD